MLKDTFWQQAKTDLLPEFQQQPYFWAEPYALIRGVFMHPPRSSTVHEVMLGILLARGNDRTLRMRIMSAPVDATTDPFFHSTPTGDVVYEPDKQLYIAHDARLRTAPLEVTALTTTADIRIFSNDSTAYVGACAVDTAVYAWGENQSFNDFWRTEL